MGADASPEVKMGIMIGTAVLMLACIFIYLRIDKRRSCLRWCLVFIVAGGLGNLIDRALFQTWGGEGVRDMVLLDFSTLLESWFQIEPTKFLDFGVCNFADFFVVGGAVALILGLFFFDTDAFFPKGKYKALAKEAAEKAEAKAKAKAERKNAGK
jgi:lipoprotein signal peptidase